MNLFQPLQALSIDGAGAHNHTVPISNSTKKLTDSSLNITISNYGSANPTPVPTIPQYVGAVYLIRVVN
jgi:hypothetical protein